MSYHTLLMQEGIESQYLAVIEPRRMVTSWTTVGGGVYSKSFTYGEVTALKKDDTALEAAASVAALTNDKFFYDVDAAVLYVKLASAPSGFEMVATYEIYLGTFDANWYRDPLDDETRVVYFEPLISRAPQIVANLTDVLYGYLPSSSTELVVSNATKLLQEHLYDSSFAGASVAVYHYLDELTSDNLKLVFLGVVSSLQVTDDEVSFTLLDRYNVFEREYRNPNVQNNFFGKDTFPTIDPNHENRPIRTVYGYQQAVIGINYHYSATDSTTTNDYHCLMAGSFDDFGDIFRTVPASPSSTTTRTYLDSAATIRVGDDVWIDSSAGSSFDGFVVVTAVDMSGPNPYIEHAAIGTAAATGSVVNRSWLAGVRVLKDGVIYRLPRDQYEPVIDMAKDIAAVHILQSSAAATLGGNVTAFDTVFCQVYGRQTYVTLEGNPYGGDSATLGVMAGACQVLVDILKGAVGLAEAELDTATLIDLLADVDDEVSFQIPDRTGADFPLVRDLVSKIAATALLRIFINDDGLWSARQLGPAGTPDKSLADDEILEGSFTYKIDYADVVSDVIVNYAKSEITSRNQVSSDGVFQAVRSVSTIATRLHVVTKQKSFESLHYDETQAQRLADRLRYYFGDRKGIITLSAKHRLLDVELGQTVTISRDQIPGYAYVRDTLRSRDAVIQGTTKGMNEIQIVLDDQKGIQDNEGGW